MERPAIIGHRYRTGELLGSGGVAQVFLAEDLHTGARCAVKIVRDQDPSMRLRLWREAETMAAIAHPNVLRVHGFGEHEGLAYIAMDHAERGSLAARVAAGPVSLGDGLTWTLEILSALASAHDAGVVHRDVKPSNILLDAAGHALLADFGVALVIDAARHTRVGSTIGSIAFMAPEQRIDAHLVDHRADLYAIGATLYLLLTGANPVDLFTAGPESPRIQRLPPAVRSVVLRATRHSPDDRYPDARRMAAGIEAARAGLSAEQLTLALDRPGTHPLAPTPTVARRWLGPDFQAPLARDATLTEVVLAPRSATPAYRVPDDERERLAELVSMALLDTPDEERFDRHTRLARRLFGVPIALVSLVDADRQWFKSRAGLVATETPREVAFCAQTILTPGQLLEVADATLDPRFRENPLVKGDPHIRFYAGFPIRGATGRAVGTLCIIDRQPRQLDEHDRRLLRDLASTVESELEAVERRSTDAETGLSNRDGFIHVAQRLLSGLRRGGGTARLVQLVVSCDATGRSLGSVARACANGLRALWPEAEIIARTASDEFCILTLEPGAIEPILDALRLELGPEVGLRWAAVTLDPRTNASLAAWMGRADASVNRHLEGRGAQGEQPSD